MEASAGVLIIEDDRESCDTLGSILCSIGYRVSTASSAKEALDILKNSDQSIVIAELQMPDMNAGELVAIVKNINPKINLLVITPYLYINSAIEVMEAGAFAYITKPFNPSEIRIVTQHALEHYHLIDEVKNGGANFDLSVVDSLTGVYNHRYLHEVLDREIARANRYPQHLCLVMIDIDDFKKYNDSKGHLSGDAMLKQLSGILLKSVRNPDMVFRYSGEEFVVLMMETKKSEAQKAGCRILEAVNKDASVTVSIGIADYPGDTAQKDALFDLAKGALLKAKASGKNKICVA